MHASVDENGRPVQFIITGGNENDFKPAPELISKSNVANCFVICDKGYDSAKLATQIEEAGGIPVIPSREWNRNKRDYDKEIYKNRNLVERFFNRMKQFRRFATRYDKTLKSFYSLVNFIAVFVSLAIFRI